MKSFSLLLLCVLLGAAGQLSLKRGTQMLTESMGQTLSLGLLASHFLHVFSNPFVLIGFAAYGASSMIWLTLVSKYPLSLVYPMVALGYVFVVTGSVLFYGERTNIYTWTALALIVAGVSLLAKSGR